MKTAEWMKIDHLTGRAEELQWLGLATAFDIINYACPIDGFGPKHKTYAIHPLMPTNHWSRMIEYPWVLAKGKVEGTHSVLDVGGGNNPLQLILSFVAGEVANVDTDYEKLKLADALPCRGLFPNLKLVCQDAMTIEGTKFDRVFCVSVLEHTPDPIAFVKKLWAVTKPGGRLLLTFDVTDSPCKDFPITFFHAQRILAEFGMEMPSMEGAFTHTMQANEHPRRLWVMMLAVDKE